MQQAAEAAAAAEGEAGGFREQALVFVPGQADDPFWDLQTELVRSPQSFAENKIWTKTREDHVVRTSRRSGAVTLNKGSNGCKSRPLFSLSRFSSPFALSQ